MIPASATRLRRVLVTGASGFVGTMLCSLLPAAGYEVYRAVRNAGETVSDLRTLAVGDIGPDTRWDRALGNIDAVVHLAARAHVMHETAANALEQYRRINVLGTRRLARAAIDAGVRRFIFASSIKVNGEQTSDKHFCEEDDPRPEDAYGTSKWEAEQALLEIAGATSMESVVLRPPLLYGPGVKGNFLSLMRAIDRGVPMPLASVSNYRSLLYLGNLVDAIMLCLEHSAAAGNTYLVADDGGVSTPHLVREIAHALGKPARLFSCPPAVLKIAGAATGKSAAVSRLLGSLQVDSGKIRRELGWRPRYGMASGLVETARWYHQRPDSDDA